MSSTTSYHVAGMTCAHCVNAVTTELTALTGVTGVHVDLRAGEPAEVTVTSSQPLDPLAVAAAVDEAGYALVRSR